MDDKQVAHPRHNRFRSIKTRVLEKSFPHYVAGRKRDSFTKLLKAERSCPGGDSFYFVPAGRHQQRHEPAHAASQQTDWLSASRQSTLHEIKGGEQVLFPAGHGGVSDVAVALAAAAEVKTQDGEALFREAFPQRDEFIAVLVAQEAVAGNDAPDVFAAGMMDNP